MTRISPKEIRQYLDYGKDEHPTVHDVLDEPVADAFGKVILTDSGDWSQIQPPETVEIPQEHQKIGSLSHDKAASTPTLGSSAPSSDEPHTAFDKMKSGVFRLAKKIQSEYGFNNGFTMEKVVNEVMPDVDNVDSEKTVGIYLKQLQKHGFVETKDHPDDGRKNLYLWVKPWQKQ